MNHSVLVWYSLVDIAKYLFFSNFQSILRFRLTVLHALLYHTVAHMQHVGHFAGNYYVDIINKQFISQTNKFADVKISTFLEKNGGMRLWITKGRILIQTIWSNEFCKGLLMLQIFEIWNFDHFVRLSTFNYSQWLEIDAYRHLPGKSLTGCFLMKSCTASGSK